MCVQMWLVVLLTHALQTMLFLQGPAAQWAGGTAGERTWHQIMPVADAARFFSGLLPSLFLLLTVLTLQRNKKCKRGGGGYMQIDTSVAHMWLGATSWNCVRGRMFQVWVVTPVCSNRHTCLAHPSTLVVESIWVYLILIEGASHPVPQRAESPPHLGAFLHLLCTILFIFIPW